MLLWSELSKESLPYEYNSESLFLSRRLEVQNKKEVICPLCAGILKQKYPGRIGIYAEADYALAKQYEIERAKILKAKPKSYNLDDDKKLKDELWSLVFEASHFPNIYDDEEKLKEKFKVSEIFLAKILDKINNKYGIILSQDDLYWIDKDIETFMNFIADKIKKKS